ncbi:MAG TPA: NUDIX hydrolase [Candidatus Dormibacteraeota bacterium]|nr:NUDIX hydrolase [Candidatus Dormibacteraeota bacterium]
MTDTAAAAPTLRRSIVAAIIVAGGKVLLVRRRRREGTLSWQLPAGEVETGETFEAAVSREMHEEVGLKVSPIEVLGERVHPTTGRHMVYLACRVVSGAPYVADAEELAELAWCRLDQLADLIPNGLFQPVQDYLDAALCVSPAAGAGIP